MGSGCGSVGRVVALDIRGPRFESSLQRYFLTNIFTLLTVEKTKIEKREGGNGPFLKNGMTLITAPIH